MEGRRGGAAAWRSRRVVAARVARFVGRALHARTGPAAQRPSPVRRCLTARSSRSGGERPKTERSVGPRIGALTVASAMAFHGGASAPRGGAASTSAATRGRAPGARAQRALVSLAPAAAVLAGSGRGAPTRPGVSGSASRPLRAAALDCGSLGGGGGGRRGGRRRRGARCGRRRPGYPTPNNTPTHRSNGVRTCPFFGGSRPSSRASARRSRRSSSKGSSRSSRWSSHWRRRPKRSSGAS